MDPEVAGKPISFLSHRGLGAPGQYCLKQSLTSFWKSMFPEEKFQHSTEKNEQTHKFGSSEVGKRNSVTLPASCFLKAAQLRAKRDILSHDFSFGGRGSV